MLQDITRTIPAGEPSIFDVAGGSLACIEANLPDFQIRFDNDPEATFRVGFEYTPPEAFKRFQVRNTRAVPLTVTFTVAEGQFRDRRQVSSAPQSFLPVTLDDVATTGYRAFATRNNGVSLPGVAFVNPAGSGITAIVRQATISTTVAGLVSVGYDPWSNFELEAVARNSQSVVAADPATAGGLNVYELDDLFPGTEAGQYQLLANTSFLIPFPAPLVLNPGIGLVVGGVNASRVRATIDHIEVPAG